MLLRSAFLHLVIVCFVVRRTASYVYKLTAPGFTENRKLTLLK